MQCSKKFAMALESEICELTSKNFNNFYFLSTLIQTICIPLNCATIKFPSVQKVKVKFSNLLHLKNVFKVVPNFSGSK